MKPVALTLKGLHSFREKQFVDFVRLCEGGVFGIFGPTGSGKSTLLDAVTLALFGKVERASNNTNGIMNHAENELYVSFCFELGEGGRHERYWVERSFKRSGEYGVHTAACRLWKETELGREVLSEKAADINKKVEELLGLTHEDFTRAVVLPQGKFAEFLTLKGAERRKMLQRIFNLEKYGDAMREKLDRRKRETEARLQAVEAEQAGLGDASEAALRAAEEKVKHTERQLRQAKRQFEQLDQELKQARLWWDWQQQRQVFQEQSRVLTEKDGEIGRLAIAVARAEEASRLQPYAKALLDARGAVRNGQAQWDAALKDVQLAEEKKAEAETAYQAVRVRRASEEPVLLARLEQLNQARKMAEQLSEMARETEGLARQREEAAQQQEATARRREGLKRHQQALEGMQQQRNAQLAERMVPAEQRHQILRAFDAKKDIDRLMQRVTEEREELEKRQRERALLQQQVQDVQRQGKQIQTAAQDLLAKMCERLSAAADAQRRFDRFMSELDAFKQQRQAALDTARINHLAHDLAKQLQEGQPCPVCGSVEHPAPATGAADESVEQLRQQLEQSQRWLQEGDAVRRRLPEMVWAYRQLAERLSAELDSFCGEFNESPMKQQHVLMQHIQGMAQEPAATQESAGISIQNVGSVIRDYQAMVFRLERHLPVYEKKFEAAIRQMREVARLYKTAAVNFQNAEQACRNQAEKVAAWERHFDVQRQLWRENYPNHTLDGIENQYARLEKLDREADALRKQIDEDNRTLEKLAQEMKELEQQEKDWELKKASLDVKILEKQKAQETVQRELMAITEGRHPDALWRQVDEQLRLLREQEQDAARKKDAALGEYQTATRRLAAVQQSLAEAAQRLQNAEEEWQFQVQRLQAKEMTAGWTDLFQPEGIEAALLPQQEMEKYKKEIQEHEDAKKQVAARLKEVEENLGENSLGQEAWDSLNRRHKEAQDAVNQWLEVRGAALEAWKTLQDKHKRFMELERQKKETQTLYQRYVQLQNVFKGNAFVEFLAEEHLVRISRDASQRLKSLTRGRYALEIDSGGGFLIRDDANGGVKRPVSSLSGGETFLTSLALALSLSASIQLRGRYQLQFFFLDEGFGTLDQELLDTVVTALERLHGTHMAIGVISHVPELQARLPRRLMVEPAEPGGRGSRVRLEVL